MKITQLNSTTYELLFVYNGKEVDGSIQVKENHFILNGFYSEELEAAFENIEIPRPKEYSENMVFDIEVALTKYLNPSVMVITPDTLKANGFIENKNNPIDLFEKTISEQGNDEALGPMKILFTRSAGELEFCLLLPEGQRLYLSPSSYEHLDQFINAIDRYEPVW